MSFGGEAHWWKNSKIDIQNSKKQKKKEKRKKLNWMQYQKTMKRKNGVPTAVFYRTKHDLDTCYCLDINHVSTLDTPTIRFDLTFKCHADTIEFLEV